MARCLFLVSDRAWTGRARALVSAARGLAARGHAIFVMAPPDSAALSQAVRESGAPDVISMPPRGATGLVKRLQPQRTVTMCDWPGPSFT